MENPQVVQIMADALVEHGVITQEEAASSLAGDKVQPKAENAVAQNDEASVASVATGVDPKIAEAAFAPPDSPAGYQFDAVPHGVEFSLDQERTMRDFFHAEGIDQGSAAHMNRLWNRACLNPLTPEQIQIQTQATAAQMERLWGEKTEEYRAIVQGEVQRMARRHPAIVEMLDKSGLGNDPWLIATILNRALARKGLQTAGGTP